ncbi:MAG TPA: HNH endonuclease signature motif containing protein [archaeon]|nr:HNH endonuclease signature motif containing protein [archaeon]
MIHCTACRLELRVRDFREGRTIGDCYPLCSVCAQKLSGSPAPSRQTLLRLLYAAGRSISGCNACGSNEELEIHFIKPLAGNGTVQSSNLLLLCRGCHDKIHQGARILGHGVGVIKKAKKKKDSP